MQRKSCTTAIRARFVDFGILSSCRSTIASACSRSRQLCHSRNRFRRSLSTTPPASTCLSRFWSYAVPLGSAVSSLRLGLEPIMFSAKHSVAVTFAVRHRFSAVSARFVESWVSRNPCACNRASISTIKHRCRCSARPLVNLCFATL